MLFSELEIKTTITLGNILTSVVVLLAAIVAWRVNQRIAARRATLDFILKSELSDGEWRRLRRRARELLSARDLEKIARSSDGEYQEKRIELATYLGHHEFVAAAIHNKTMDKKLYEAWNRTGYGSDWDKAKAYVFLRRSSSRRRSSTGKQSSRYEHFEKLGKEWGESSVSG